MPAKRTASPDAEAPTPATPAVAAETPPAPPAPPVSNVRRISNPRPKKLARPVDEPVAERREPTPEPAAAPPAPANQSTAGESGDDDITEPSADWPYEPDEPEVAGVQPQEGGKRKRRRRKGKGGQGGQGPGGQPQAQAPQAPASGDPEPPPESQPDHGQPRHGRSQQPPPPRPPQPVQGPRAKLDPELLAKHAWKIFLAEVSEEGIALINDQDARDLTRRCFRLAEIFLEEQTRRA